VKNHRLPPTNEGEERRDKRRRNKMKEAKSQGTEESLLHSSPTIREEFLSELKACKGFPHSEVEASILFEYVVKNLTHITGANILRQLRKKIKWWKEHPGALKYDPLGQLKRFFEDENEVQKRGGLRPVGETLEDIDHDHMNFLLQIIGKKPKTYQDDRK
jgi:hypothetical protein